jgi:3-dehydroquinate synthetase
MRSLSFSWRSPDMGTSVIVASRPDLSSEMVAGEDESRFWVVDARVAQLWPEPLGRALPDGGLDTFLLKASEETKSTGTLLEILRALGASGAHRGWRMVAVGGGVTMDIAAMAASLYNRGMHLTLVPTTLLGMVDACLGGKTGLNMDGAKNQLGTLYPADRVAVFTGFTTTLHRRELRNGLSEALKTAVVADRGIADILAGDFRDRLPEMVERCLRAKASVIGEDLQDRGRRQLLNLGHTLGHALESASGFDLNHGEAVALGMLAAARMADRTGADEPMYREIADLLRKLGLPVRLERAMAAPEVMEYVRRDKKTVSGGRRWVLPMGWERCRIERLSPSAELSLLEDALKAISP